MSSDGPTEALDVLATVGTDHHPFARLIAWLDRRFGSDAAAGSRCLVQTGASTPGRVRSRPFLTYPEMEAALAGAGVVVCHGGPGTIMMALGAGKKPIVVPRRSDLGEHVDDHQVVFSRRVAASEAVWLAETQERLNDLLDLARVEPELFRAGEAASAAPPAVAAIESLVERLLADDRGVLR